MLRLPRIARSPWSTLMPGKCKTLDAYRLNRRTAGRTIDPPVYLTLTVSSRIYDLSAYHIESQHLVESVRPSVYRISRSGVHACAVHALSVFMTCVAFRVAFLHKYNLALSGHGVALYTKTSYVWSSLFADLHECRPQTYFFEQFSSRRFGRRLVDII